MQHTIFNITAYDSLLSDTFSLQEDIATVSQKSSILQIMLFTYNLVVNYY